MQTVKAGTTVNFVNKSPSEPHNVAFGPLKYIDKFSKQTDLLPEGPGSPNQVTPFFVYGSDPPPARRTTARRRTATASSSTPLADGDPRRAAARVLRIKFTTPGKYHFICLLHGPDMAADIVVTQ